VLSGDLVNLLAYLKDSLVEFHNEDVTIGVSFHVLQSLTTSGLDDVS
jgi:hypothetical protein